MYMMILLATLGAVPETPADTAVVCPNEFRAALQPWVEYRREQGHSIRFVAGESDAATIRGSIRRIAEQGKLRYVLVVGDADPAMDRSARLRARSVPTHYSKAVVNVRWGSEPEIAADNWFADLDDDRVPDVAIGRLTADTPQELAVMVEKILAYERSADFAPWRRRINFVAGLGGFGKLADTALEMTVKRLLTDGIPSDYATNVTYASWQSPYCPDPRHFHEAALARINEGCLFWVYIGHGQRRLLDSVHTPGGSFPILADRDMPQVACRSCPPIACFLACYTAAFDQRDDCLAEAMLRSPDGPVAVIGGSRVTMPYAMSVLGTELLDECFVRKSETIGQAILVAKQNMIKPAASPRRAGLDTIASLISPAPVDLVAERAEHLDLFHLLGDPLLRLRHPQSVKLELPKQVRAGEMLSVSGESPVDGTFSVELVVRRDRLTFDPPRRDRYEATPEALAKWTEVYQRANDPRWVQAEGKTDGGKLSATLRVPSEARGPCHVRVYVRGAADFAMSAADVQVVAPAAAKTAE